MSVLAKSAAIADFADLPVTAFTTTREVGSFAVLSEEPVRDVMGRWGSLRRELQQFGTRLATAGQVHGDHVIEHVPGWRGWLRGEDGDGHFSAEPGTAMVVTVAD